MRADEVGRVRGLREELDVADFAPVALQHDAVDQRIHEGRVGLGLDRHPFAREGAGHRQVRLDLDALQSARTGVGLPPDARDAPRGLVVAAEVDDVVAVGRVHHDRERAVPELSVKVLRVEALRALAGAVALVQHAPRREEGGKGPHVARRRAAAAEARGEARVAFLVAHPLGLDIVQLGGHDTERLVPRDLHEARVVLLALFRVGALQRPGDAVRVVGLLHEAVGLHADAPARGVHPV